MSGLSVEQRGDLAERMLPVAAHLALLVHGDGGPQDVAEALAGLSETEKGALIVVLAGLVDPDQPVGKALSWLDVTKHGALPVPAWLSQQPLKAYAPEPVLDDDDNYIDEIAVQKHLAGKALYVTWRERMEAVARGVRAGMTYPDFDQMYGLTKGSTSTFVSRTRLRLKKLGEPVPSMERPDVRTFTEDEVVRIRERSVAGAPDVEIAMSYGVSRETIRAICRGQRYAQYGGPVRKPRKSQHVKGSREYMCGHAKNSRSATRKHEMGVAA